MINDSDLKILGQGSCQHHSLDKVKNIYKFQIIREGKKNNFQLKHVDGSDICGETNTSGSNNFLCPTPKVNIESIRNALCNENKIM